MHVLEEIQQKVEGLFTVIAITSLHIIRTSLITRDWHSMVEGNLEFHQIIAGGKRQCLFPYFFFADLNIGFLREIYV